MTFTLAQGFTGIDWLVLALYFAALAGSGWYFARREQKGTEDYFLGGRRMPVWAVAVSIVATSMSAASFVGVPEQGYQGDLTYLATNIGMVIAAIIVAGVFIPAFYAKRVQTIYELLEDRGGVIAVRSASAMFMIGRVMASGARIYIGAIPASLVLFGVEDGLEPGNLLIAVGVLTTVGVLYTLVGGIASVIWTDVVQMGVLLGACGLAIVLILSRIPVGPGEIVEALSVGKPDGSSKLLLFDLGFRENGFDFASAFTLPAAIIGFTLMGVASYGTDHDLVQRMLTCKDAKSGSRSVIAGILFGIPSVALFLIVGLLLYVYYQRPDLMGQAARPAPDDSRQVFLSFIINEMPAGLTGLMMAGLFAAGLSSLNSAINAMGSAFINDFYRPMRPGRDEKHYLRAGRFGVAGWGIVLGLFAGFCVYWQMEDGRVSQGGTLLTFALQVMTFAYSGLLGVFLTVLLTKRGNSWSCVWALVVGFVAVAVMNPALWSIVQLDAQATIEAGGFVGSVLGAAFGWKLAIATAISFVTCQLGSPKEQAR